ncbi:OB-fold domain-containing protein [Streptomyces sp. WMMC500]|uniref:OB-fold domain-containing protein n=1 Tax=Streptomyces sp. WMMC500 TaxID=3015154 RepID=UPI00248B399C|nr:OB-fold domain-containing protein [Streptomyces sp. WMMC500]WBB61279.1 OB-fold domain-containing protein [Streptomyces sp. WMMC500]
MRGILGWGTYVPFWRLDRGRITPARSGARSVAGYDEDATTMGVAAARLALRHARAAPTELWFATADPPYLDRTNATAVHAALRLDRTCTAYDAIGSVRSATGALRTGLTAAGPTLVVVSDLRTGRPGGPDEAAGGDAAAALVLGSDDDGPVLAELVATASVTAEFLDRWRIPGEPVSRLWEERFGEKVYADLGHEVVTSVLDAAGVAPGEVGALVVAGLHAKSAEAVAARSGVPAGAVTDRLDGRVGNPGAAQPAFLLAAALERAAPGQVVVLVSLADGADAFVWRTTPALREHPHPLPMADQLDHGRGVPYLTFLAWRGMVAPEPPRRPEPARASASAALRNQDWKFGFVGSADEGGTVSLPPSPLDSTAVPMAGRRGTVVTCTVDRLAYSPSPPVLFAVVDFDGGGRLPVELTDVDGEEPAIGDRVEMTFRRLHTADGVHNYFWKARPVREKGV